MFLYFNLVYFFFNIYVQHYSKLSYIKYHKIIRASYEQPTSYQISLQNVTVICLKSTSILLWILFLSIKTNYSFWIEENKIIIKKSMQNHIVTNKILNNVVVLSTFVAYY